MEPDSEAGIEDEKEEEIEKEIVSSSRSLRRLETNGRETPTQKEGEPMNHALRSQRSIYNRASVMRRARLNFTHRIHPEMSTFRHLDDNNTLPKSPTDRHDFVTTYPEEDMEDFRRRASQRLSSRSRERLHWRQRFERFVRFL